VPGGFDTGGAGDFSGLAGETEFLDIVGAKRFEDTTLPQGTAVVTYRVQAVRSRKAGPFGDHVVYLGVDPGTPREMFGPVRGAA
jgi:hypothetical protein